jgi:hypothetical protein
MKRGLKRRVRDSAQQEKEASFIDPMKRGLKLNAVTLTENGNGMLHSLTR